ncbi:MAG: alkaline phosphatase family protein [Candidatus Sulfotelmatobacter sp.]
MCRSAWLSISILLFCGVAFLLGLNGCSGVSSGASTTTTAVQPSNSKIQHVVIIFQENRTPDNLFHDPVLMSRGADIASAGVNSKGRTIPLGQIGLAWNGSNPNNYDLDHTHPAFTQMCDLNPSTGICAMDGADLIAIRCGAGVNGCPANPQFMYVDPADVQPYFEMAEQYTFADRMFQTNQGPSFPAHQFIISGTSAPTATSSLFAAENVRGDGNAGCTVLPTDSVAMIDALGQELSSQYPCFEHATLTDFLNSEGVSWRYYTSAGGLSIWTAPNAIQHMCGPNVPPPNATACTSADWRNNVVMPTAQNPVPVLADIADGQLPTVSWVIPNGQESDHPEENDGSGPSWVAAIVNAIGSSQYWSNTAIFITWDDWGGWYDHVAPQVINDGVSWGSGYVYGFRVPLIVVSPYAKAANISHVKHDFGSILKFIEENFGLPSLGYADAAADDLSDCFNYNQTPLPFQTITAPLQADHFLNDKRPPTDPDDD